MAQVSKRVSKLLFPAPLPAAGQDPPATSGTETRAVQIDVAVRDSHGPPVHGLTKDDFTILDDGKPRVIDAKATRTAGVIRRHSTSAHFTTAYRKCALIEESGAVIGILVRSWFILDSMRVPVALFAISALFAIPAYYPLWVCLPEQAQNQHSCCPHSQSNSQPPCDTNSQTCPYLLLQKAKSIPVFLAAPPLQPTAALPLVEHFEQVRVAPSPIRDEGDLYLRNRVLLL
jgi:hypothetical protein